MKLKNCLEKKKKVRRWGIRGLGGVSQKESGELVLGVAILKPPGTLTHVLSALPPGGRKGNYPRILGQKWLWVLHNIKISQNML